MKKIAIYLILFLLCLEGCKSKKMVVDPEPEPAPGHYFPDFRMPPLNPSAKKEIEPKVFSDCINLRDVSFKLSKALESCGYERVAYHKVQNGFAMVTQLEIINSDGTSRPDNERWSQNGYIVGNDNNYIYNFFFPNPVYYRFFVFIISNINYSLSEGSIDRKYARDLLISGVNKLPYEIGKIKLKNDHYFDVLIYEFKKNENDSILKQSIPSSISGMNHLINSNIAKSLLIY